MAIHIFAIHSSPDHSNISLMWGGEKCGQKFDFHYFVFCNTVAQFTVTIKVIRLKVHSVQSQVLKYSVLLWEYLIVLTMWEHLAVSYKEIYLFTNFFCLGLNIAIICCNTNVKGRSSQGDRDVYVCVCFCMCSVKGMAARV